MMYETTAAAFFLLWFVVLWTTPLIYPKERTPTLLEDLIILMRMYLHPTYVFVLLGALYGMQPLDTSIVGDLILVYISFNVLLYGGIYVVNQIVDREQDAAHPRKHNRPLAAGRVSPRLACVWAAVLIVAGIGSGLWWFGSWILPIYAAFLAVNAAYTFWMRNVAWLDLLGNGLTYPLRVLLGASLVGAQLHPAVWVAMVGFALVISAGRRVMELDQFGWENHEGHTRRHLTRAFHAGWLLAVVPVFVVASADGYRLARIATYALVFGFAALPQTVARRWTLGIVGLAVAGWVLPMAFAQDNSFFLIDSLFWHSAMLIASLAGAAGVPMVFDKTFVR